MSYRVSVKYQPSKAPVCEGFISENGTLVDAGIRRYRSEKTRDVCRFQIQHILQAVYKARVFESALRYNPAERGCLSSTNSEGGRIIGPGNDFCRQTTTGQTTAAEYANFRHQW